MSECSSSSNESIEANSDAELRQLEKAKSAVWDYFGFPTVNSQVKEKEKKKRTEVYYKLCPKRMQYQGSTTNMLVHLQYNHQQEYSKIVCPSRQENHNSALHTWYVWT